MSRIPALFAAAALLLAGCSQSLGGDADAAGTPRPRAQGKQGMGSPDGVAGAGGLERVAASRRDGRTPGRSSQATGGGPVGPRFARLDSMVRAWDEAQGAGELAQAETLRWQLTAEVDGNIGEVLAAAAGRSGNQEQIVAVSALGFATDPQATSALILATGGTSPRVVGNALIALSLRKDPNTPLGPILGRMTRGSHQDVRRFAPLALANVLAARREANLGAEPGTRGSALERLNGLANDHDGVVRLHVAKALGALGHPGAVDLLSRLIRDDRMRVRFAAAAALVRTGDPRGFPLVVRLMHDSPGGSKHLVRDLLSTYAGHLQGAPLDTSEIEHMGVGATRWSRWYSEYSKKRSGA